MFCGSRVLSFDKTNCVRVADSSGKSRIMHNLVKHYNLQLSVFVFPSLSSLISSVSSISSILIILKKPHTFSKSHLIKRVQLIQKLLSNFLRKIPIKSFVSHIKVSNSYLIIYKTIRLIYVVSTRHTTPLAIPIEN